MTGNSGESLNAKAAAHSGGRAPVKSSSSRDAAVAGPIGVRSPSCNSRSRADGIGLWGAGGGPGTVVGCPGTNVVQAASNSATPAAQNFAAIFVSYGRYRL
ncbi:hypothetical protein MBRA_44490 [Mycobacterium branderi]|uniref:Uncharacterized protein n=1 Tax=Mycobacterium branderi TaxID=43348 RepID=A0ABN6BCL8_9MYCO|nr:hypothetical protein MBRA_44490 [Mycobacterium branderi]